MTCGKASDPHGGKARKALAGTNQGPLPQHLAYIASRAACCIPRFLGTMYVLTTVLPCPSSLSPPPATHDLSARCLTVWNPRTLRERGTPAARSPQLRLRTRSCSTLASSHHQFAAFRVAVRRSPFGPCLGVCVGVCVERGLFWTLLPLTPFPHQWVLRLCSTRPLFARDLVFPSLSFLFL